jgi:hypothetical protein
MTMHDTEDCTPPTTGGRETVSEALTGRELARRAAQALADAHTAAVEEPCDEAPNRAHALVLVAQGFRELAAIVAINPQLLPERKDNHQ